MMCLPVDQPDKGPDQGSQLEITEAVERDLLTRHVSGVISCSRLVAAPYQVDNNYSAKMEGVFTEY